MTQLTMSIKDYNNKEGSIDLMIIREAPREYGPVVPQMKGATVIDIGANIGCFTALAVNAGAKKVYSVEPASPNIIRLKHNAYKAIKAGVVEIVHGGIVANKTQKTINLRYFADGLSMGNTKTVDADDSLNEWRGRPYTHEAAPAINFIELLVRAKPDVLKMDCEGAEYPCLLSLAIMPPMVKTFIAEFHKTNSPEGFESYMECTSRLKRWGFKPDREPNLVKKYKGDKFIGGNQFFVRPIAWRRT